MKIDILVAIVDKEQKMIKRILFLLAAVLLTCATLQAQLKKSDFLKPQPIDTSIWKARGPMTIIATGVCVAGQSADLISSTGREANGFLRGANGRINMSKAVPLKLGMCIAPAFLDSKLPKWARVSFRIAQFAGGGIGFYDFTQNRRYNHK